MADDGNSLPGALRARLFYLYQFTAEHSRRIRAGAASPEVLVEINTAVLRGLRGEGTAA
ncbi:MAG: flagellar biosynthesis regulator FlaF [Paracoccaceae bacterium]